LLAAVWLCVPLLALLHGGHAHRFCAEHGTFEEGATRSDADGELRGPRAVDTDAAPLVDAGHAELAWGHEDCPLFGARPRQVPPGPFPDLLAEGRAPALAQGSRGQLLEPQVAPLIIAPKGSPPPA
jgi:hypothetical protein